MVLWPLPPKPRDFIWKDAAVAGLVVEVGCEGDGAVAPGISAARVNEISPMAWLAAVAPT